MNDAQLTLAPHSTIETVTGHFDWLENRLIGASKARHRLGDISQSIGSD